MAYTCSRELGDMFDIVVKRILGRYICCSILVAFLILLYLFPPKTSPNFIDRKIGMVKQQDGRHYDCSNTHSPLE